MGSVKDLIVGDSPAGKLYFPPSATDFGCGAWQVSGRFSVGDLKKKIPDSNIRNKAEALTMTVAAYFEWMAQYNDIPTCYLGILDKDGKITDVQTLLKRGDTSNIIYMKLAHTPQSFCEGDLEKYRQALRSGELKCGVADVESIFRLGYPLGSSTFEKIFQAVGWGKQYESLATYDETTDALNKLRVLVAKKGLSSLPELEKLLADYGLGTIIPNPGFILKNPVYDSTTKFESSGDRFISKEEEVVLSGLSREGYEAWTEMMFPESTRAQIRFCEERNLLNIDGKVEIVSYHGNPIITDFMCSQDENRLMIVVNLGGVQWAIPSNKEIQRAVFRQAGVYAAIGEAKARAEHSGQKERWLDYFDKVIAERKIDLKTVTDYSCDLMSYAVVEVANRALGKPVFDTRPVESWVRNFMPFASRVSYQK